MPQPNRFNVIVDEIGMRHARHGDLVIDACYRPIFARTGAAMRLAAVQGVTAAHAGGETITGRRLWQRVPERERAFVRALSAIVQVENLAVSDLADLDLVVDLDHAFTAGLEALAERWRAIVGRVPEMETARGSLLLRWSGDLARDPTSLSGILNRCRRSDFGAIVDIPLFERTWSVSADMPAPLWIRLASDTLCHLSRDVASARLLSRLTGELHRRGFRLLVEGIADANALHAAADAGADLFAGDFLGLPMLAGTQPDRSDLPFGRLARTSRSQLRKSGGQSSSEE